MPRNAVLRTRYGRLKISVVIHFYGILTVRYWLRILDGKIGILGKMSEGKQFYTVKDLEELLFLGERAIRDRLERGEIKGFKVGGKGKWLVDLREVQRLKGRAAKPDKIFEGIIGLVDRFRESLCRIGAKDWVVWHFPDAPWLTWDRVSTDKHPAELRCDRTWDEPTVDLKLEVEEKNQFRRLILLLESRYPEFRRFAEWKLWLAALIQRCQQVAYGIWRDAETKTEMMMISILPMVGIQQGLYNVPKFTYDFAVDNYGKDGLPRLCVMLHGDSLYKLVPEDNPDYILAVGSQKAMDECEEATVALCKKYAQDPRIGKIKEEEAKVKTQAICFRDVLLKILADSVG